MKHVCWYNCLTSAHKLIGICGIYLALEFHTCHWHLYGNGKVNKSFMLPFLELQVHLCGVHMYTTIACSGIFVQGHMQILQSVCVSVFWWQWLHVRHLYWQSCLICTHTRALLYIYCINVACEGHIFCQHIYDNVMWSRCCCLLFLVISVSGMVSIYWLM